MTNETPRRLAYVNGNFVDLDHATVSILDRGNLFGDGVYEVIPVYNGQFFGLQPHLARLLRSLAAIGLSTPETEHDWANILQNLVEKSGYAHKSCSVYLQVSRGAAPWRDAAIPAQITPNILAFCQPLAPIPAPILENGVGAGLLADTRWANCHIKAITLLANVLLRDEVAKKYGANEAILHRNGLITEGSSSNVFIVKQNQVITPPLHDGILAGVTRRIVLDLLSELKDKLNLNIQEREISLDELKAADEIWITSSTREIYPITMLDGTPVGIGKPDAIWRATFAAYQAAKSAGRF